MSTTTVLKITTAVPTATLTDKISASNTEPRQMANKMIDLMAAAASGTIACSMDLQIAGGIAAPASGTLTLSGVVNTNTCTINSVTFTCVTSGATGNQFNVGVSDTLTAANLAAAINGSVTAKIAGYVTATSSTNVVTITAAHNGILGNLVTLSGGTHDVAATGTITGSSVVATNTFTINGVTFTAVASGATGNQFNVGMSDNATMANAATAVNGSVSVGVTGVVTAAAVSTNVMTITATTPGSAGNAITITGTTNLVASGAHLTGGVTDEINASGAALTGGLEAAANVYHFGA